MRRRQRFQIFHCDWTAPAGKQPNWVPTNGRDFEILFRFCGPEKPLSDKTWTLPDVEEMK